jgi:rRNA pseudouridine-1189 N-methylase Emg1 (Nep1/Mra1 family)
MAIEIARLLFGLLIVLFHRPIADFITERERSLVVVFRQRGMMLPPALTTETSRTLYFAIGVFIAIVQMLRIYTLAY